MFLRYNYLGVAWGLMILVLCGLPGDQFQKSSSLSHADKAIHALLFAVLFFLLNVGFIKQRQFPELRKNTITKVMIFSMIYGLVIELLQGFVFVGRSVELLDILFNLIGCVLGYGLFLAIYGRDSYV